MPEQDRLIQGSIAGGDFRVIAARTTDAVETARVILDLSPVASDAMGRALTGAVLLARLLEKQVRKQRVTLRFDGNGPLGVLIAEGTLSGQVRGYVQDPTPADTTLDVPAAIGYEGRLTVIRGTPPSGKPYTSQLELSGSGVASELTRYLATSEQISSAVLLGVLNKPAGVAGSGGIVVQAFPHASEASIAAVEEAILDAPPLSTLVGAIPIDDAVRTIFGACGYKRLDSSYDVPITYSCSCSRERALLPLSLFSVAELRDMMRNEGGSEVTCQFCGRKYRFSREDLLTLTATSEV